jgi:hypothetical protein
MKELVFLLIGLLLGRYAIAQTANEILDQNAIQLKYLAEQIAALRSYTEVLQQGYEMVGDGLDTIGNIKAVDLTMHADYFKSLETVNPVVAGDIRVNAIRAICSNTVAVADLLSDWNDELGPMIASNLDSACQQDENWLKMVVTNGDLQLEDAQRLAMIGMLYEQAKARYSFTVGLLIKFGNAKRDML